ncbi:MAG: hypothetical protein FWF82_00220 [Oscillospiraceae bacterium]|nr:hypothetical protein [Oscillospiraceae bacterium]
MKKFKLSPLRLSLTAAAVLILAVGLAFIFQSKKPTVSEEPNITTDTSESQTTAAESTSAPATDTSPDVSETDDSPFDPIPEPTTEQVKLERGDWKWHVQPTIVSGGGVFCCSHCGFALYMDGERNTFIDEQTGLPIFGGHGGHGGGYFEWVYDPDLDLFGYHDGDESGGDIELAPFSQIAEKFPECFDGIQVVERVDSTNRNTSVGYGDYFNDDAFSGIAVFFEGEFLTDFVYQRAYSPRKTPQLVSVRDSDDKYGVIGSDGEIWVPFEFDYIGIVDSWTAFAEQNGRLGIIAFNGTVPEYRNGKPVPLKDGDRFNGVWSVVEKSGKFAITDNEGNALDGLYFDLIENCGKGKILGYDYDSGRVFNMRYADWYDEKEPQNSVWVRHVSYENLQIQGFSGIADFEWGNFEWVNDNVDEQLELVEKAVDYLYKNNSSVKSIKKIISEGINDYEHQGINRKSFIKICTVYNDNTTRVVFFYLDESERGEWTITNMEEV